ncbi:GntR family transcriptional regulator [Mycolicibacterium iranicum]|uniref:GntR family transcriptional regulator n=1 Tax=Mycolicibacterium iranicum TaxID=912594 RepID=A0A178M091_MYCIR|nr:GntR family transcriptional regulator [Mycolicibacterium iranicum]OAN40051.1 GntR family transcriptional regulator [Mycolicibacterium iranicum]
MSIPEFAARPQLAEDVARLVRRRIFDGIYPAGKYIRLEQLADELGISVTPVREALFGLRAEGLLNLLPRRGFVVLPITERDIADVSDVQAHIGGELASRAAERITDDELHELGRIQDKLEVAYGENNHEAAVRLNHAFHRGVNLAAGSPKLAQLMGQITRFALESVYPTVEGWPAHSMRDHRVVLDALKKRDGEAARTAMSEHLCAAAGPLIDHLTKRGVIG